jgi:hypothetical protein
MNVAVGYYRAGSKGYYQVDGLSFQPNFLIYSKANEAIARSLRSPFFKMDVNPPGWTTTWCYHFYDSPVPTTDIVSAFTSDGFTLTGLVYSTCPGCTFNWLAMGKNNANDFAYGTYEGTGIARTITNADMTGTPDYAWVKRYGGTYAMYYKTSGMAGTECRAITAMGSGQPLTNALTGLVDGGFTLGTNGVVNAASIDYWYFMAKNVPGVFHVWSYTGNGANDTGLNYRVVTPGGGYFAPDWFQIQGTAGVANQLSWYSVRDGVPGRLNPFRVTQTPNQPAVDGQLIGWTDSSIQVTGNLNLSGYTYHCICIKATSDQRHTDYWGTARYIGTDPTRKIVPFVFAPDMCLSKSEGTDGRLRIVDPVETSAPHDYYGIAWDEMGNLNSNFIYDFSAAGVETQNSHEINALNKNFHMVSWKDGRKATMAMGTWGQFGEWPAGPSVDQIRFKPDLVIAKRLGAYKAYFKTVEMPGTQTCHMGSGNGVTNAITSFDPDGFTIDITNSDLWHITNPSGYYWCFKKIPGVFNTGTYKGNGQVQQQITGMGFWPRILFVKAYDGGDVRPAWKTKTVPTGKSLAVNPEAMADNKILSLDVDGFTVGSDSSVNAANVNYYWFAWGEYPDVGVKVAPSYDFRPYRQSWHQLRDLGANTFVNHDAPGDPDALTYVNEVNDLGGTPRVIWFEGSTTGDDLTASGTSDAVIWNYTTGIVPLDEKGEVGRLLYATVEYKMGTGTQESLALSITPYVADVAGDATTYSLHAVGVSGVDGSERVRCSPTQFGDRFKITVSGQTQLKQNIEIRKIILEWVPLRAGKPT